MTLPFILLGSTFFLTLTAAAEMATAQAPPVLAEFAIGRDAGPIIVPVTVGGTSYPFLLDTGTSVTGFDVSLRSSLGPGTGEETVETPAGPVQISFARAPAAYVGRLPLAADQPVMLLDTTFLREATGLEVRGILGMDFLSQHVVCIDFDRGRLRIASRTPSDAGRAVPLKLARGIAWVEADVSGAGPTRLRVDTGMLRFSTLNSETYRMLEGQGKISPAGTNTGVTCNGPRQVSVGRLEGLQLGPFEHRGLHFYTTDGPGALGLGFWARYTATFDFPSHVVYLKPSSRHATPDQLGGSGLGLLCRDGQIVVVSVEQGSPAAKAGLREGDKIQSIEGVQAGECSLSVLGRQLSGEGRTVHLVIWRGGELHELALHLETTWRTAKQNR